MKTNRTRSDFDPILQCSTSEKSFHFFLAKTWLSLSHLRAKKIATSLEFDIGNGNGCDFSANSTPAFLWWDFLDKNKYLGRNRNDFPFFFFLFFLLSIL